MTEPITHVCARCRGTQTLGAELLLADEVRVPAGKVGGVSVFACPTCTPYGPFGLVPVASCIEGGLIGQRPKTRGEKRIDEKEQAHDRWLHWILEE